MLDHRAERKLGHWQVCSEEQYTKAFDRLNSLPSKVERLIIQLGIPIAYPRMVFLEHALSSKYSPFVALGRLGIGGFLNRFNGDAELLDDLVFARQSAFPSYAVTCIAQWLGCSRPPKAEGPRRLQRHRITDTCLAL